MTLTPDQIAQYRKQYSITPSAPQTGGGSPAQDTSLKGANLISFLKTGKLPNSQPAQEQPQEKPGSPGSEFPKPFEKGAGQSIAESPAAKLFTGSTQEFGKTAGEALVADKNTDLYSKISQQHSDIQNQLQERIAEDKKIGKDTTKLEAALTRHQEATPKQEDFTGDVIQKTGKDIALEAGGTVLEALGGGVLEGGAKIAEKVAPKIVSEVEKKAAPMLAKRAEKKSIDLVKSTEETMTKKERQEAIDEGRTKVNKLGQTEYLPSKTEARAGKILQGKLESNPVKNVPIVKKEIASRGKEAEKYLEENAKPITASEQADMFKSARDKMEKYSTESELKAYDEQMNMFTKLIPGKGGYNTANFYKALKEYESNVASKLARGKEALLDPTGAASAKLSAAKDIRTIVRDEIGKRHDEFKDKMFDLASLYDALDNTIIKAEKTGGTAIGRFAKKHPYISGAISGAVGIGGIEEAKKLTGL